MCIGNKITPILRTKVLFIYKSGTLVKETPTNFTLEKVFFYPVAISHLVRIATELNYNLIMILNQVDIGTENFPRVLFYVAQKLFLRLFKGEGIYFYLSFYKASRNTSYFFKIYNHSHRYQYFIIGNKIDITKEEVTIENDTNFWKRIFNSLKFCFNESSYRRRTKETDIQIFIKIDGKGISDIKTGYGFLDHILDQICIHANIDLGIKVKGDFYVDEHHSIEDTAISLGIALSQALKDKRGITRYGFLLPMDDTLVQVSLDLGGRSNFVWKANFEREKIGAVPTEMFAHFFKSFSDVAYCNIHIQAEGNNEHHKIEAIFKAFACALKIATSRNYYNTRLPSTKEIL